MVESAITNSSIVQRKVFKKRAMADVAQRVIANISAIERQRLKLGDTCEVCQAVAVKIGSVEVKRFEVSDIPQARQMDPCVGGVKHPNRGDVTADRFSRAAKSSPVHFL